MANIRGSILASIETKLKIVSDKDFLLELERISMC